MKLETQVVSLELAKKLKELGVKQESYFRWTFWASPNGPSLWDEQTIRLATEITVKEAFAIWNKGISAFTVAELGEMLPWSFYIKGKGYHFEVYIAEGSPKGRKWGIKYQDYGEDGDSYWKEADTEADARAKCLIYLLENNLLTQKP